MKKIGWILLVVFLIFVGIAIGQDNNSFNTQEEIKQFEKEITEKDNNYVPKYNIEGGSFNGLGQKGEEMIDKAFDVCFGILKKIIN